MKFWLKISLILIISTCAVFAVACKGPIDDKKSSDDKNMSEDKKMSEEIPIEWPDQWG